jgi:UDP-N-acetylglucosamine acyltransferase
LCKINPNFVVEGYPMSTIIHPTAIVEEGAQLGENVRIGPFCLVGSHVKLGDGCDLKSHVVIVGHTTIGSRATLYPHAAIGHQPQDFKYHGEASSVTIGSDCLIREGVTIHPGTEGGGMATVIGDRCSLFMNSHVAHDCRLGNNVLLSGSVLLGGHCTVGDFAIIGGGSGIHQFCRIGTHAFLAGMSAVANDVIPYGMVLGNKAHLNGLNMIGLKRRGFSREAIHDLRRAYRLLFAEEGTLKERIEDVGAEFSHHTTINEILDFIREGGDRPLCTPNS